MKDALDLAIIDVKAVSLVRVDGEGDQAALTITTRRGSLTLRLIATRGGAIRFSDRRGRRGKRAPAFLPFEAIR